MLGIDSELEHLFNKAQQEGVAVIKDRWTSGNYGCCSTSAPLVEKYKIEILDNRALLSLWGTLVATVSLESQITVVNTDYKLSNYEKKIVDWFVQQAQYL
ncbi:hypothetical protein P7H46_05320 [Enterococcus pseudoavium]|uniref:Uncharacterized protein n=1 Tax=Enterococcus pseudoavium TaxID=44007 RepID=A0ABU3FHE9_9ENTE|nr:hypothetical protein [Enterococcus pseudoavium]MDT2754917.1 hypothetical protein [Enterococcus pseudoavium]MDT2770264.1 hypothetical protein [Enterococcus pseudoavium]